MSAVVASAAAVVIETAKLVLRSPTDWPAPASGFAYRVFTANGMPKPSFMSEALRETTSGHLRRTPELAGFGYVIDRCDNATVALWLDGIKHLRGRDIYPADRQSFIFNPIEILGVAHGLASSPSAAGDHRKWFANTILRGIRGNEFRTIPSSLAATTALACLEPAKALMASTPSLDPTTLPTPDLTLVVGIGLAFTRCAHTNQERMENAVVRRVLSEHVGINDAAEAATLLALFGRLIDGITLGGSDIRPAERIIALCRRFPLFVERLQKRQHGRAALAVADEYDVQDLLHAILRLHFDDIRPEEYTPSYGGSASRVDFYLPRECVVVESKMTRATLGQREVTDELIIDAARYARMDGVDTLICLIPFP
jgi:REase_DpnII-MboI